MLPYRSASAVAARAEIDPGSYRISGDGTSQTGCDPSADRTLRPAPSRRARGSGAAGAASSPQRRRPRRAGRGALRRVGRDRSPRRLGPEPRIDPDPRRRRPGDLAGPTGRRAGAGPARGAVRPRCVGGPGDPLRSQIGLWAVAGSRRSRLRPDRVSPDGTERLALHQALDRIESEDPLRHLADGRQRLDDRAFQGEMIAPGVDSRIEEADQVAGRDQDRAQVASLIPIARQARMGQVLDDRQATVLLADDVIDLAAEVRGYPERLSEPPTGGVRA
jgi:hypothetical protein